jgi:hypothetical protein
MADYKIIGGDHREYGPATVEEMRLWISEGRLSYQSLVQIEGSAEWRPLSTYAEFADALAAQSRHDTAPVTSQAVAPRDWLAEVQARKPELPIGECLAGGWGLLKSNFGLLFGAVLLVWFIENMAQMVPLVGPAAFGVLSGVFYGGLYLVFLKRLRGEPAVIGDALSGFSIAFAQLMLAGLISWLLTGLGLFCFFVLPGIYLFVAWKFSVPLVADKRLEFWSAMELSRKVVTRVWFEMFVFLILAFLPTIVMFCLLEAKLSAAAQPIMQKLMDALKAPGEPDMGRFLSEWLSAMLELAKQKQMVPWLLAYKIVILLNLPFAVGALMVAYEKLFGPRTTPSA